MAMSASSLPGSKALFHATGVRNSFLLSSILQQSTASSRSSTGKPMHMKLSGGFPCKCNAAIATIDGTAATERDRVVTSQHVSQSPTLAEGRPLSLFVDGLRLLEQRMRVGTATFRLIAPEDVDAVMDLYITRGLNDCDPYWARAWPSAIALAGQILSRPELVKGAVVADIGCGLGLAGLAAVMAGAREVVLLDREPLSLQCALLSGRATGFATASPHDLSSHVDFPHTHGLGRITGSPSQLQALSLAANPLQAQSVAQRPQSAEQRRPHPESTESTFGHGAHISSNSNSSSGTDTMHDSDSSSRLARSNSCTSSADSGFEKSDSSGPSSLEGNNGPSETLQPLPPHPHLRAHVFDWAQRQLPSALDHAFDVVLASDVLYELNSAEAVAAVMPRLLRRRGGTVLLADPPNRTASNRQRFLQLLSQQQADGAASWADAPATPQIGGSPSNSGSSPGDIQYVHVEAVSLGSSGLRQQSGTGRAMLRIGLDESYLAASDSCMLDAGIAGGLASEQPPVQFMLLRSRQGNDTVGLTR